jgi:hypothetical protein
MRNPDAATWLHSRDSYLNGTLGRPHSTFMCAGCGAPDPGPTSLCARCLAVRRNDDSVVVLFRKPGAG